MWGLVRLVYTDRGSVVPGCLVHIDDDGLGESPGLGRRPGGWAVAVSSSPPPATHVRDATTIDSTPCAQHAHVVDS